MAFETKTISEIPGWKSRKLKRMESEGWRVVGTTEGGIGGSMLVTLERQVPDEDPRPTLMTRLDAANERLGDRLDRKREAKERREAERASTNASEIVLRTEFETTDAAVFSEVASALIHR